MLSAPQRLAASLPPLLVAAERVAATVAQGVHGRRRAGIGDAFWQYRPFVEGDAARSVDWRRSARGDRLYVRDTEWEAAQSVCLWRDASPSMAWRSAKQLPSKQEAAELLLLAAASLLWRAGEQVRPLGEARAVSARQGLDVLAAGLARAPEGLPPPAGVPRHAQLILAGDFLAPLPELAAWLAAFAALPARVHLLQVLDPAEMALPYAGRVRFLGLGAARHGQAGEALIPRVEAVRGEYQAALAAQLAGLRDLARLHRFGLTLHRTDAPPEAALLALYMALDAGATKAGQGMAGLGG